MPLQRLKPEVDLNRSIGTTEVMRYLKDSEN